MIAGKYRISTHLFPSHAGPWPGIPWKSNSSFVCIIAQTPQNETVKQSIHKSPWMMTRRENIIERWSMMKDLLVFWMHYVISFEQPKVYRNLSNRPKNFLQPVLISSHCTNKNNNKQSDLIEIEKSTKHIGMFEFYLQSGHFLIPPNKSVCHWFWKPNKCSFAAPPRGWEVTGVLQIEENRW